METHTAESHLLVRVRALWFRVAGDEVAPAEFVDALFQLAVCCERGAGTGNGGEEGKVARLRQLASCAMQRQTAISRGAWTAEMESIIDLVEVLYVASGY